MTRPGLLIGPILTIGSWSTAVHSQGIGYLESTYAQLNLGAGVAGEADLKLDAPQLRGRVDTDLESGLFVSGLVGNS